MGAYATSNVIPGGDITGSGTTGQVAVWTSSSALSDPAVPFTSTSTGFTVGTYDPISEVGASIFSINSTTQGVLLPILTTSQMLAVSGPAPALLLYNSTEGNYYYYNNAGEWANIASLTPTISVTGNLSAEAWTTNGIRIRGANSTYTDTSSVGVVPSATINAFRGGIIAASNAVTYTAYYGSTFGLPVASTNVTIEKRYSAGFLGDISLASLGSGISIKEGANCKMGVVTINSNGSTVGTSVVNTTKVTTNSRIFLTIQSNTPGASSALTFVDTRVDTTSFTIGLLTNVSGNYDIAWMIIEPT